MGRRRHRRRLDRVRVATEDLRLAGRRLATTGRTTAEAQVVGGCPTTAAAAGYRRAPFPPPEASLPPQLGGGRIAGGLAAGHQRLPAEDGRHPVLSLGALEAAATGERQRPHHSPRRRRRLRQWPGVHRRAVPPAGPAAHPGDGPLDPPGGGRGRFRPRRPRPGPAPGPAGAPPRDSLRGGRARGRADGARPPARLQLAPRSRAAGGDLHRRRRHVPGGGGVAGGSRGTRRGYPARGGHRRLSAAVASRTQRRPGPVQTCPTTPSSSCR